MSSAQSSPGWLRLCAEASEIANSPRAMGEKFRELAAIAARGACADLCLVLVLEEQTRRLVPGGWWPQSLEPQCAIEIHSPDPAGAWALTQPATLTLCSRAHSDPRFHELTALSGKHYEAVLSAPLTDEERVVGRLNVYHRLPRVYTAEETAFVLFVAQQLGAAVSRHALREGNRALQREVELLRDQLETRKLVERAKGILQQRLGLTEEDAYFRLRNESRRQRRPMKELAREIIEEEMRLRQARDPGPEVHRAC